MAEIKASIAILLAACGLACAGPVAAGDLQLSRTDVTELTQGNVGKPFWSLQAQCAGVFGAGYAYEIGRQRVRQANDDEAWGEAMLNDSVARLQADRAIDHQAALDIAAQEVEYGRNQAKMALQEGGTAPEGQWNLLRSACLDVSEAYGKLSQR